MNHGQIVFLGLAALILFWQIIKGWRLGCIRQFARFAAIGAAYLAAYWGASSGALFLKPLGYPNFILLALAGAAIWLAVYLVLSAIGALLFKRTAHQELGLVWFFYGSTGALMGALFGLLLVLIIADMVRICGSFSEGVATNVKKQSFVAEEVMEMKKGLDHSTPGDILKTLDPLAKKTYVIAEKTGRVISNVENIQRFLSYPGSQELAERPDIQALREDPSLLEAAREGRIRDVMKNPKVVRALDNPKTAELFRSFHWEEALDYALGKPAK